MAQAKGSRNRTRIRSEVLEGMVADRPRISWTGVFLQRFGEITIILFIVSFGIAGLCSIPFMFGGPIFVLINTPQCYNDFRGVPCTLSGMYVLAIVGSLPFIQAARRYGKIVKVMPEAVTSFYRPAQVRNCSVLVCESARRYQIEHDMEKKFGDLPNRLIHGFLYRTDEIKPHERM